MIEIIAAIFFILSLLAFFWMVIGLPVGLVLLVIYLLTNDHEKRKTLVKWIVICLASILMFALSSLFGLVMSGIQSTFGVDSIGFSPIVLPRQDARQNNSTPLGGSGIVLPRKN